MKKILPLVFIFSSVFSFSQTKKEIKITEKQLKDSKSISDLISDIPKDCKVHSFHFSANVKDHLKEFTCVGEGIVPELKTILLQNGKGQSLFIEKIKSDCEKSHKAAYKLTLEE